MTRDTMKNLPADERPYEKCMNQGPEVLSDAELLAVILRSGTREENSVEMARRILRVGCGDGRLTGLARLTASELMEIKGVGPVKAVQILCLREAAKRIARAEVGEQVKMDRPELIAAYYMEEMRHKDQEEMKLVLLNTRNCLMKDITLTRGTVNASLVSPREIFLEAFRYHAVNIVVLHNHPSGDPSPSQEDIEITRKIMAAGEMVDIPLLDHIIIGDQSYVSMKASGFM